MYNGKVSNDITFTLHSFQFFFIINVIISVCCLNSDLERLQQYLLHQPFIFNNLPLTVNKELQKYKSL